MMREYGLKFYNQISILLSLVIFTITTCSERPTFQLKEVSEQRPRPHPVSLVRNMSTYTNSGHITIMERVYNPDASCVQLLPIQYTLKSEENLLHRVKSITDSGMPAYLRLHNDWYTDGIWARIDPISK